MTDWRNYIAGFHALSPIPLPVRRIVAVRQAA
jgi:hypothetical protein